MASEVQDKLREAAFEFALAEIEMAKLDRILGYSELVAAIREVLICAWKYDDKPHHLFTAIIRLAETLPDEFTPEIRRLMSEAYNAAGPRSELLEQRDKLVEALAEANGFIGELWRTAANAAFAKGETLLPWPVLQHAESLLRDLDSK